MTFSLCVREGATTDDDRDADATTPSADDAATDDGPRFGVAVATDAPAVGALAPYVGHRGAVSTQAFVNVRLGRKGIRLLEDLAVDDALPGLLAQDDDAELRQLHGVDDRANSFAYTGDETEGWSGHEVHDDRGLTVAGNMLTGPETLGAVAEGYADSDGRDLVERLVDALAAGRDAGGDKRGHSSAAVAVAAPTTTAYHDLRVDEHGTPIEELRRVYGAAFEASDGFSEDSKSRIFD